MKRILAIFLSLLLFAPAWAIERNVANQKLVIFAFDYSTGAPKTGDAANLTAYAAIDGDTTPDVLGDTAATELSATNAPGWYQFDLTAGETNGTNILYSGKSATGNVVVRGFVVATTAPNFGLYEISAGGTGGVNWGNVENPTTSVGLSGTTIGTLTTYSGNTPQTGDAYAVMNSRLPAALTAGGNMKSDVLAWLGTAPQTPYIAGIPLVHAADQRRIWYVDDTDGAGDTGSFEAPFDTFAAAIAAAADGDTIFMLPGTYPAIDCSSKKFITVQGVGATSAISTATGNAVNVGVGTRLMNLAITSTDTAPPTAAGVAVYGDSNADFVRISGCTITAQNDGIYATGGRWHLENNLIASFYDGANLTGEIISINNQYRTFASVTSSAVGFSACRTNHIYSENDLFIVESTTADDQKLLGLALGNFGTATVINPQIQVSTTHAGYTGAVIGIGLETISTACFADVSGGSIVTSNAGSGSTFDAQTGTNGKILLRATRADAAKLSGNVVWVDNKLEPTVAQRKLAVSSGGLADADMVNIAGAAITDTADQVAAAFSKFFDKATPTGTINSLPDAVAGAAGGIFIAGTNAPVTITGSGNALTLLSTGANGNGIQITGNGSGYGLNVAGGATGGGGLVSGDLYGLRVQGTGAGTSYGFYATGSGSGSGIHALGGATGDGMRLVRGGAGNDDLALANSDSPTLYATLNDMTAAGAAKFFSLNSGTTYAAAVAGSVVKEIADNAGGSGLTVAGIADGVWDEVLSGHLTVGTTGKALNDAGAAGNPWTSVIADNDDTAGTFGYQWGNHLAFNSIGIAQGGGSTTIQLAAAETYADNELVGNTIALVNGTGRVQARSIIANTGTTDTVTVSRAWTTQPVSGTKYQILPLSVNVDAVDGADTTLASSVPIDMTQAVPVTGNVANSIGDTLNAARAYAFGKWVVNVSAKTLTIYGPDGTTVVKTFDLTPTANAPTTRTPQ